MMRVIWCVRVCVCMDFSLKCLLTVTMKWLARISHRTIWSEKHLSDPSVGWAFSGGKLHAIAYNALHTYESQCVHFDMCEVNSVYFGWMVRERHSHWFYLFIAFQQFANTPMCPLLFIQSATSSPPHTHSLSRRINKNNTQKMIILISFPHPQSM